MSASKAQQAATAERRRKAIGMKLAGVDWQSIADQLGYASRGAACTDVTRSLANHRKQEAEAVDELRQMTVMRYDRLQAAYWPKAVQGDAKAADIVLKCLAGRAKIEGVEAPTRVNVDALQLGDEITSLIDTALQARRDEPS